MGSALVWVAIPHNSDGVVFQVRVIRGLQRFHIARSTLEAVFGLTPKASDAHQLELFYRHEARILSLAMRTRPIASADTAAMRVADFDSQPETRQGATAGLPEVQGYLLSS